MARQRATRSEWAKRVGAWKKSGLSAGEFAAREGLSASSLSWWSWKLGTSRRATNPSHATAALTLVPLRVAPAPSAVAAEATTPVEIAIDGCVVRVRAGFDRATLLDVLDLLRERAR